MKGTSTCSDILIILIYSMTYTPNDVTNTQTTKHSKFNSVKVQENNVMCIGMCRSWNTIGICNKIEHIAHILPKL